MSPSLGVTHHLLPPLRLWLFPLRNHCLGALPCCVTAGKLLSLSESQEPLESREMSRVWEARRRQGSNNDPGVSACGSLCRSPWPLLSLPARSPPRTASSEHAERVPPQTNSPTAPVAKIHCELLVRRSPRPHLLCQAGRDNTLSLAPAHTWAASVSLHQLPAPPSAPSPGKFPERLCQVRCLPRISYLPVPTPSPDTWSLYLTHLQLRAQYPTPSKRPYKCARRGGTRGQADESNLSNP